MRLSASRPWFLVLGARERKTNFPHSFGLCSEGELRSGSRSRLVTGGWIRHRSVERHTQAGRNTILTIDTRNLHGVDGIRRPTSHSRGCIVLPTVRNRRKGPAKKHLHSARKLGCQAPLTLMRPCANVHYTPLHEPAACLCGSLDCNDIAYMEPAREAWTQRYGRLGQLALMSRPEKDFGRRDRS